MKRAAAGPVAVLVVALATGCQTTRGKVLGATSVAAAATGNALLLTADDPMGPDRDARATIGMSLVGVSTLALLVALVVDAPSSSAPSDGFEPVGASRGEPSAAGEPTGRAVPRSRGGSASCSFGDCTTSGWREQHPDGTSTDVSCAFGDCTKHGWRERTTDGAMTDVTCSFGDCGKHGWTERTSSGTTTDVTCAFGDCGTHGWRERASDGTTSDVSCKFGDCTKHGWTERRSDGTSVDCTCNFGDCTTSGVTCR